MSLNESEATKQVRKACGEWTAPITPVVLVQDLGFESCQSIETNVSKQRQTTKWNEQTLGLSPFNPTQLHMH